VGLLRHEQRPEGLGKNLRLTRITRIGGMRRVHTAFAIVARQMFARNVIKVLDTGFCRCTNGLSCAQLETLDRTRIAGRRFRIARGTVWNLLTEDGKLCGQAAIFDRWEFI